MHLEDLRHEVMLKNPQVWFFATIAVRWIGMVYDHDTWIAHIHKLLGTPIGVLVAAASAATATALAAAAASPAPLHWTLGNALFGDFPQEAKDVSSHA